MVGPDLRVEPESAPPAAPHAASESASARLPLGVKLAYGFPNLPGMAMSIPIGIFMTKFYADTVGVSLGFIALAQAAARSIDAITDPLMGWLSDRTRTRWGRRRPYMLVGAPLTAIALVVLFYPPVGLDPLGGAAWFTTAFVAYYVFQTIYSIPHAAQGPELTSDYHERSNLFAWRDALTVGGVALATSVPALVMAWLKRGGATQSEAERTTFMWFAVSMALLLVGSYVWLCYRVPENPAHSKPAPNPLVPGFRRVFRSRPFRILLGCTLATGIAHQVAAGLLPFYLQYTLGIHEWVEVTGAAMFVAYALGSATIPGWLWLTRRFGKKAVYIATFMSGTLFDLCLFSLPSFLQGAAATPWVIVFYVFRSVGITGAMFVAPSIAADVIDYDELHTGKRREAQYGALWSIVTKLAVIPALAIPLSVLGALGFESNVEQTATVSWAIRSLYGGIPAVILTLGIFLLRRFPIDEQVHRATLAGVDAHRRGESTRDPLTGRLLAPPTDRGLDEKMGWFLDHFSVRELRSALRSGRVDGRSLKRDTARALLTSTAIFAASAAGVWLGLLGLESKPGLLMVCGVVLSGVSLSAVCFHAIRLNAARQIRELSADEVRVHLEITEGLRLAS